MLKKTQFRALAPGQWATVRVPDLECWREGHAGYGDARPGDLVQVCITPILAPREGYDSFEWNYRCAYRKKREGWVHYQCPDGGLWILPCEFLMHEAHHFHWDRDEYRAHLDGQGRWLYEPASDDPELCPGGDWSIYRCDKCEKVVTPFSNDDGDLICPNCEVTGLVITDEDQLERLEQVRDFARQMGLSDQLERQLHFLGNRRCWGEQAQTVLSYDFAPHSFAFAVYQLPTAERPERRLGLHGGLIYQGPDSPADGSFPSLTVSLASGTGWFTHT